MKFLKKTLLNILLSFSLFLPLFSCTGNPYNDINKQFNDRYSKEVKKYRDERTPPESLKDRTITSTPPTEEEIEASIKESESESYYAYVDVSEFGEDETPQQNFPNGEVYELSKARNPSNQLPPNMFEITYYTNVHPPFTYSGVEFDAINIPPKDAYGVNTRLSKKTYLLAGRNSLQQGVDKVHDTRTREDIEMSETLIKEKRQMVRKKKMIEIFGEQAIEVAQKDLEENTNDKEEEISDKSEEQKQEQDNATNKTEEDEKKDDIASVESNKGNVSLLEESQKKVVN